MSVFNQLEKDLDNTLEGLYDEFEILKIDSRNKDYRKFLKKLQGIKLQMEGMR